MNFWTRDKYQYMQEGGAGCSATGGLDSDSDRSSSLTAVMSSLDPWYKVLGRCHPVVGGILLAAR